MTGVITLLKDGCGTIRAGAGTTYHFTRNNGAIDQLRPGDLVAFTPVGPRWGRWRAQNVALVPAESRREEVTRLMGKPLPPAKPIHQGTGKPETMSPRPTGAPATGK